GALTRPRSPVLPPRPHLPGGEQPPSRRHHLSRPARQLQCPVRRPPVRSTIARHVLFRHGSARLHRFRRGRGSLPRSGEQGNHTSFHPVLVRLVLLRLVLLRRRQRLNRRQRRQTRRRTDRR